MAKTTVILASRTEQENFILHKKLEDLGSQFRGLEFVGVHPQGVSAALDKSTGAVILNLSEWTSRESKHLDHVRSLSYNGPVLITAKGEVTDAIQALKSRQNVSFLPKPYELKSMQGILRKYLLARSVAQQLHRRFATEQDAAIESASGKIPKMLSTVRNLSKSGALLELPLSSTFKVGDLVRLTLELKDLKRTYLMPAKVVWTSKSAGRVAGTAIGTVGVMFVGRPDVARQIVGL